MMPQSYYSSFPNIIYLAPVMMPQSYYNIFPSIVSI